MPGRGRPLPDWLLILLLGQLSVRASVGGIALMMAPAGTLVGVKTEPLDSLPIGDFFLPGLVLVVLFGLLPAIVCYGLYTRRGWARTLAIAVALALLGWVLLEVAIGFTRPTVFLNIGTSIGIVAVALYPAVRREQSDRGGDARSDSDCR